MIIAVVNQKGGTGKTTTTVNLGKALALKKKKVILLDMDPQGSMGYSLGIIQPERTIADVFAGDATIEETIIKKEGMDVIPSDVSLADIELSLAEVKERNSVLKSILEDVSGYDFVLIDCPPSLSLLTVNALCAAEKVLVPMQMEVLSLQGLDLISQTIEKISKVYNPELRILGIVPVMVDKRRKLTSEINDHIRDNYDFFIFKTQIRANVRASEAPSFGESVINYAPKSNSAVDYVSLAKEFLSIIK